MSLPPLITFSGVDTRDEIVFAWLGTGAQLVDEGMRVLLVSADPSGRVERLFPEIEQSLRRTGGSGLMSLTRNVEARPELIDMEPLRETLFGRAGSPGVLVLLPALRLHEAPDPSLAARVPVESKALARAIRGQLWQNDRFDAVLALLPPGASPLGDALRTDCADLSVELRNEAEPGPADQGPVLLSLGTSYADKRRLLFPPIDGDDGVPARTKLRASALIRRCELLSERLRARLEGHPRLLRAQFRDRVRSQDWDAAEHLFGRLWVAGRDEALDLFQEEMLRGIRVPAAVGAAVLRAVSAAGDASRDELLHIAGQTLQKFRWSRPNAASELTAAVLLRLLAQHDGGEAVPLPGRLIVDAADALCHLVLWRRQQGASHEETWPLVVQAHELLGRRAKVPMRPSDNARWARTAATFTRLTGDSACINELRDCLDQLAAQLPRYHLLTASLSLLWCGIALRQVEMLEEVVALCDQLVQQAPAIGLYRRAVAWVHMGFYADAMLDLQELGRIDRDAALEALIDPDFRPLWSVAGDPNLTIPRPR